MNLATVKVKTHHHTSTPIHRLTVGKKNVFLGTTGFGIAIDPYDVGNLAEHGYLHLNNQVVSLPAIPIVHKERLLVISTGIEAVLHQTPTPLVTPQSTYIVNQMASNAARLPSIVDVDMARCMVPVVTDDTGKVYMSTTTHKVLYVNDVLEAQATIMQVTLPLPDELLDLGRRFVRAVLAPDTPDKEDFYIYMKDRFINVF